MMSSASVSCVSMVFVFKQKTAYEMRISGWSSDVCSSDLKATARYGDVSTEKTGHAEAVRITYDPARVSYGTLLRVYFSVAHDPTQLNRQGPDRGPSYRSAIFPQTATQQKAAAAYIAQLTRAHAFKMPIVTRLERGGFYPDRKSTRLNSS